MLASITGKCDGVRLRVQLPVYMPRGPEPQSASDLPSMSGDSSTGSMASIFSESE